MTWKQTLEEVAYFFDDMFEIGNRRLEIGGDGGKLHSTNSTDLQSPISDLVLTEFLKTFNIADDKDTWWKKITDIATALGIKNGDVAMALRVAITGRTNTPDLYSIMQVMGDARVRGRIEKTIK